MGKHTISDLHQMQSMPLHIKMRMTENRIRGWVEEYGEDGVYVSFSGGKDSTVLLHICRKLYPNLKAVFFDTGLEYPELREFVKSFDNVEWIKPKKTFRQVIEEYGYPFISKEISNVVKGGKVVGSTRWQRLQGTLKTSDGTGKSQYNCEKWKFMLDAPFDTSDNCCRVMKKSPAKAYHKTTGRVPILGQLATESLKRTRGWLKTGCNAFDLPIPQSNPMAFWTDQDILEYILKYIQIPLDNAWEAVTDHSIRIKYGKSYVKRARKYLRTNNYRKKAIASVYGYIKAVNIDELLDEERENLTFADQQRAVILKTTGCQRTGCMFCGYGCHLEKPGEGRFKMMKETHPKQYDYLMRPKEQGGLNYKEVIDWINEHGGFNIEY